MSDFFGGLRSGIRMPEVVFNQGPLPSGDGLPAPLHELPDARINYNSALLGDITPYAYGAPGYLSSQTAYLNIPHKIQKVVPVIHLPDARPGAREHFPLSHPIDDGDVAFALRLDRQSLFCTGLRSGEMRRAGLGTAVDPFVNLPTLNYILSGMQLGVDDEKHNMWRELLHNLDARRFGGARRYAADPVTLEDVVHVVRHCARPYGIVRGSEKQGGQSEESMAPVSWPVSFVVSLTIDGKESNVINLWHHVDLSAGDDLVLRLKPMPLRKYTLNHYYKGFKEQSWSQAGHVWQLVPDLMGLDAPEGYKPPDLPANLRAYGAAPIRDSIDDIIAQDRWQSLGYWHIGRSQIMTGQYGHEAHWHNDMANSLRTNHLDITFQPVFLRLPTGRAPVAVRAPVRNLSTALAKLRRMRPPVAPVWTASLTLERLPPEPEPAPEPVREPELEPPSLAPKPKRRQKATLLRADGTLEPSAVL